jgi:hypothetical protein
MDNGASRGAMHRYAARGPASKSGPGESHFLVRIRLRLPVDDATEPFVVGVVIGQCLSSARNWPSGPGPNGRAATTASTLSGP